jgi:RNA polymerase sigma-70 factor (ECF subfamily)
VKGGELIPLRGPAAAQELSDEALARACAAGDPAAVAALFDRFHPMVTRCIRRLIGDRPDVQDLLQATFLEIARGTATYDGERGEVRTWLLAIATNMVRHHRRGAARRLRLFFAAARERPPAAADIDEQADARARLLVAQRALEALPDEQREAFVLCQLEGLPARDAARILGASEATVWKRVSKARRALRARVLRDEP